MGKSDWKKRYKLIAACGHVLCLMLAVGVFYAALGRCLVMAKGTTGVVFIDPFETDADSEQGYTGLQAFQNTFRADADALIPYLAVSRQFESGGEFDADKVIDLLSYYLRKNPNWRVTSDGLLEYRAQDLITWFESYGFMNEDGELVEEVFPPVDGVSIYDKREEIYALICQYGALIKSVEGSGTGQDGSLSLTGAQEELVRDPYLEAEENQEEALTVTEPDDGEESGMNQAADKEASVEFYPADDGEVIVSVMGAADSHAMNLTTQEASELFNRMILSVASDLYTNFTQYQAQKDYFAGSNFKYLYIPEKRGTTNQYYTNFSVGSREEALELAREFKDCMAAYVIIDANGGNIEEKTVGISTNEFLRTFGQYKYALSDYGGKIYFGVLDETKAAAVSDSIEYHYEDLYAQMSSAYEHYSYRNGQRYAVCILILVFLSLVFLVVYTTGCGRTPEDREVHLIAFDRIYTELALLLGLAAAAVFVGFCFIWVPDVLSQLAQTTYLYRLVHDNYLLMAAVFLVAVMDAVFWFFYGSLVRRIKAGTLLQNSLFYKLLRLIWKLLRLAGKALGSIYRHGNVGVRTIVSFLPFLLLMYLHLQAGVYLRWSTWQGPLLAACFVLDTVLLGLFLYGNLAKNRILQGIDKISSGELEYQVDTQYMYGDNRRLAEAVNHIGDGIREAVNQSMKDERMKADLITNVSHDIKTPLTSIINYVDLLKREKVEDEKLRGYIEVLDAKSQRLKQLTEDLVEASKISSGNIVLNMEELNVVQLLQQAMGEFTDRFEEKELHLVTSFPDTPCMIRADSRRMWRVMDNLLGNIYKYSMEKTRVYIEIKDLSGLGKKVSISMKNISKQALNIDADELTERFIRGDISRSTEGSGLGLSIAKSLIEAQEGMFNLYLDGDLFKVTIIF